MRAVYLAELERHLAWVASSTPGDPNARDAALRAYDDAKLRYQSTHSPDETHLHAMLAAGGRYAAVLRNVVYEMSFEVAHVWQEEFRAEMLAAYYAELAENVERDGEHWEHPSARETLSSFAVNPYTWLETVTLDMDADTRRRVQQEVESHFRQTVDAMLESGATLVAARTVALASLGKPGKARRRYRKTFHKPLEQRMLELDEKAWAQFHSLNFFGLEYMGLFCAVALCLFGIVALITPYEMTSVDLKLALIALAVAAACGALAIQLLKSKRRIRLDSLTLHERVYLTLQMAALGYGMFPFFHLMPIWSLLRESQVRSIDLFFCCIFGLIAVAYFGFSVRYWLASRRVLRQPKPHATG